MLTLLLSAALALPLAQDGRRQGTDDDGPKTTEEALLRLEGAFSSKGDAAARERAIREAVGFEDARIVALVAKGFDDQAREVRLAAAGALRYMEHPDALKSLHRLVTKEKDLREDAELFAAVLKAVGEHADESSIELLADDLFAVQDREVIRARILSLGRIRSPRSVEALFDMMRRAGRNKVQPLMVDLRLALVVLTGADQGLSQDLWQRWWNDHKKKLAVSAEPPLLAEPDQKRWDKYWDVKRRRERGEGRGERGGGAQGA